MILRVTTALAVAVGALAWIAADLLIVPADQRSLDVADVEGVWTEEGGGGRLTIRGDGTASLTGASLSASCEWLMESVAQPAGLTWTFGDSDEPRALFMSFQEPAAHSCGLYVGVDGSGERAIVHAGNWADADGNRYSDYVREPR
ncbi:hypothetical protein ACFVU3_22650 [Streptomyces sp. NPDC058052]|uniref:hypothetical protein n=1 Tax=Streptomyces sp. NPDC058052 TaxID=3346316 RepID=UPI0036F00A3F